MKFLRSSNRGFTLIELLVVISLISMLASVVIATVSPMRAQARDAKRKQEVHQVDLAIQSYIADNGHPPELSGCEAQTSVPTSVPSGCIAVSTASISSNPSQYSAWQTLKTQLSPYMKNLPVDPCGTCASSDGSVIGYTYISPLAVQYFSNSVTDSYRLSAALETATDTNGSTGSNTGGPYITSFGCHGPCTIYVPGSVPSLYWTTVGAATDSSCYFMESPRSSSDPYNSVLGPNPANVVNLVGGLENIKQTYILSLTCYTGLGRTGHSSTKTITLISK